MRQFEAPELALGALSAAVAGRLIASAADVALLIDDDGVIRDLAFSSDDLLAEGYHEWLGKPWAQTVTVESRPKVEALLRDSKANAAPRWRHINHPSAVGADLPLSYSAVSLRQEGRGASAGYSVAFGRDLRANAALQQRLVSAQQSMERDYWRLRHMETRYRSLFEVASEAVLILESTSLKLEEANPAAARLLGDGVRRPGWSLVESFESAGSDAVRNLLAGVRATGRAGQVRVKLTGGGEHEVAVSIFRQEKAAHLLVRLSPTQAATPSAALDGQQMLLALVESAPDAFVVTDLDGVILAINQAFLDLAQLPTREQALGESLANWLGRTGVDLNVLINNLRQRGAIRLFATSLRGQFGSASEVEISAVAVADGERPCLGFTIRDVGRRLKTDVRSTPEMPRSVGQMTELVGRVPLKDIVRDTTDLIEQLCIEAALELTGDNRASAAEMLGLSRQSLYVKLRRFNLGDLSPQSDE